MSILQGQVNRLSDFAAEPMFEPDPECVRTARVTPLKLRQLQQWVERDDTGFWAYLARSQLSWLRDFSEVRTEVAAGQMRWFKGGRLNVAVNCLDRHLALRGDKLALSCEAADGEVSQLSYRQLHAEVCRLAQVLEAMGIAAGDPVLIDMPELPQAVMAMLACARIGAVHLRVPSSIDSVALEQLLYEVAPRLVITVDSGIGGGRSIDFKARLDGVLDAATVSVEQVLVYRRCGGQTHWRVGRDHCWRTLVSAASPAHEARGFDAMHPLMLSFDDGSAKAGNILHMHPAAGSLLTACAQLQWIFDLREEDVLWATLKSSTAVSQLFALYAALAAGTTLVLSEDAEHAAANAERFWRKCRGHGVSLLLLSAEAALRLSRAGPAQAAGPAALRLVGTSGDPLSTETFMWWRSLGIHSPLPVLETWQPAGYGAPMMASLPGATTLSPGSCAVALPGTELHLVDACNGRLLADGVWGRLRWGVRWPGLPQMPWSRPSAADGAERSDYWAYRDRFGHFRLGARAAGQDGATLRSALSPVAIVR